ncbi:hypothetical protein Tco_1515126 [Tanacetum coccineum]
MRRGRYALVKEKMLKGRVNKDGEYPDDEIRLVGDKLVRKKEVMQEEWEVELHTREGMVNTLKNQLAAQGGQFQSMSTQLTLPNVSSVNINPINSSADEEGRTIVVGCENDASIQKSCGKLEGGLNSLPLFKFKFYLEVVEKLLEEEMLMGSSNHLVRVMLVIWEHLVDEFGSLGDGVFMSSWVKSTNNCFGGMMLIFGLLETLEMEALVEAMNVYGC